MRAQVVVRLKSGVLDPQGEAVQKALGGLGYEGVEKVRIGKLIELELDAKNPEEARAKLEEMADKLLANPVIESYEVLLEGEQGR